MSKKQIFIIGSDAFNLEKLNRLPDAGSYEFQSALTFEEMRDTENRSVEELVELCISRIDEHGRIDGVASYYDFPGTILTAIVAGKYNLPGPTLESVIKCENKYWSRLEQQKVIQEHIPEFKAFDPFDDTVFEQLNMITPFWIKPIKSFRSFLAYRINGEAQFYENMQEVKAHVEELSRPFNALMERSGMPDEFATMKETCIAESLLSGHQCTLEGYVHNGQVISYGIVDSVREDERSSFARYEYPSVLPQEIQFRMADVTRRAITQIGLDNSPFNVEFFYNPTTKEVYLLEINPRISQAHTDMFEKVHGISHHAIMVNLALGRKPDTLHYNGTFNRAANFMLRTFESGTVRHAPTQNEINILKKFIPGLEMKLHVKKGMHLGELRGQDSYSYELANIYLGGRDQRELVDRYQQCVEGLTFDIEYDEAALIH